LSFNSSSISSGTLPEYFSSSARQMARIFFALVR